MAVDPTPPPQPQEGQELPLDANAAADCLLFLVGSLLEKLIAFRRLLRSVDHLGPEASPPAQLIETRLNFILANNRWSLVRNNYRSLRTGRSADPWSALRVAIPVIRTAQSHATQLAWYTGLLPAPTVPPGVVRALDRAYPGLFSAAPQPAVAPLPGLIAHEFDLAAKLSNDPILAIPALKLAGKPVIRVPAVDAPSAMCLATLAHEFGHAVDQRENFTKGIPEAALEGFDAEPSRRFAGEFFADAVAFAGMGPAAILQLLPEEGFLLSENRFPGASDTHPSTLSRIAFVKQLFGEEALAPFARLIQHYEVAVRVRQLEFPPARLTGEATLAAKVYPRLMELAEQGFRRVKGIPNTDVKNLLGNAGRLADRIRRKIPPAAIRWHSKESLGPVIASLSEGAVDPAAFRTAIGALRECPASPAEILAAAQLTRMERWNDLVHGALHEGDLAQSWEVWTEPLSTHVEEYEDLMRAGLIASETHSALVLGSEELQARPPLPLVRELARPREPAPPDRGDTTLRWASSQHVVGLLGDLDLARALVEPADAHCLYMTPLVDPARQIGPASIDIRLGSDVVVITNAALACLDPAGSETSCEQDLRKQADPRTISATDPLILHPGEFALASSLEYFCLPGYLAGRLEGRSSLGRAGVLIHATAGFIDPGYKGFITLELSNAGKVPIKLYPGIRIGQLSLFPSPGTKVPYSVRAGSKYRDARRALQSRIYQDKEYEWLSSYLAAIHAAPQPKRRPTAPGDPQPPRR